MCVLEHFIKLFHCLCSSWKLTTCTEKGGIVYNDEDVVHEIHNQCYLLWNLHLNLVHISFGAEVNTKACREIAKDVKSAVENNNEFGKRIVLSYTYLPVDLRSRLLFQSPDRSKRSGLCSEGAAHTECGEEAR